MNSEAGAKLLKAQHIPKMHSSIWKRGGLFNVNAFLYDFISYKFLSSSCYIVLQLLLYFIMLEKI